MAYWVTNTVGSAARLYAESARAATSPTDPVGGTGGGAERSHGVPVRAAPDAPGVGREAYDLVYWSEQERGGHFAAFERPQAFVDEVRAFRRVLPPGVSPNHAPPVGLAAGL